uniref:receptor-interacting serine/threonine-protein kinase 3-like isoform X2 n=1 Tax=Styela clava TaxID=7725 RepID=UPI001939D144|nr:receptor-interacting serine/threonine-protein kinase 3-like isoform X2 [Styela clava]
MAVCNYERENEIRVIDFEDMEFIGHLGRGGMSKISLYKWKREESTILVAMKSLLSRFIEDRYKIYLQREMAILATLEHENIIQTFGVVETDQMFGLVIEYSPFGSYNSFFRYLAEKEPTISVQLMVPIKIQILSEIISAMKYLHSLRPKRILHLDLKSDNVLLDSDLHAKLCDFGLSTMSTLTELRTSSILAGGVLGGTLGFIAPERLRNVEAKPTTKADVYSFGILMWEIMADEQPFAELGTNDYHLRQAEEMRPNPSHIPDVFPNELLTMMQLSWSQHPIDRPSFKKLDEDMLSIIERIQDYKGQVRESRIIILRLYESVGGQTSSSLGFHQPCDSSVQIESSVPQNGKETSPNTSPKAVEENTTQKEHPISMPCLDNEESEFFLPPPHYTLQDDTVFVPDSIRAVRPLTCGHRLKTLLQSKIFVFIVSVFLLCGISSVGIWLLVSEFNGQADPYSRCISIGGTCHNWYEHDCSGGYKTGLCDGEFSNTQCCLPCNAACKDAEASYKDIPCGEINGICKHKTNYCSQTYIKEKCDGPEDRRCCPPNPADTECTKRGGMCQNWVEYTCVAGYRSGLCIGGSAIRCCLPCDTKCYDDEAIFHDPACDSLHGTCMDNTNYCASGYLPEKCHGPDSRQCCPP